MTPLVRNFASFFPPFCLHASPRDKSSPPPHPQIKPMLALGLFLGFIYGTVKKIFFQIFSMLSVGLLIFSIVVERPKLPPPLPTCLSYATASDIYQFMRGGLTVLKILRIRSIQLSSRNTLLSVQLTDKIKRSSLNPERSMREYDLGKYVRIS